MISTDRPDFGRPKKDMMSDDNDEGEIIVNVVSDSCNNISVPGQT